LLFAGLQRQTVFPLADFFFRINPLSALTAMLASRAWIPRLGWALVIVGLTVLIGRVWCGWICPFGTLLEWVTFRKARQRAKPISPHWRTVKYALLVIILVAALFGNLTLLIFEPLALFTRAMTTIIIPALNYTINATESTLYSLNFLRPAISWLESIIRGPILPVSQPVFNSPLLIASLFFGIITLNLLAKLAPAALAARFCVNRGRLKPFPPPPSLPVKSRSCLPSVLFAWTVWRTAPKMVWA
jgi:hypothetical protein